MKRRNIILFLLSIVLYVRASAQNTTEKFRHFDSSQMERWRGSRAFRYQKGIVDPPSLWERFKMWLYQKWAEMMSTKEGQFTFWAVVIGLSVFILIFFTYKYMSKTSGMWSKSDKDDLHFSTVQEENIHEINFEQKIKEALDNYNYRLAIRLQYLYILKIWDDRGHITWLSGKTNQDYIREVGHKMDDEAYQLFRQISVAFDFAWYGEHDATLEDYNAVKQIFDQLKNNSFTTSKTKKDERI